MFHLLGLANHSQVSGEPETCIVGPGTDPCACISTMLVIAALGYVPPVPLDCVSIASGESVVKAGKYDGIKKKKKEGGGEEVQ